MGQISIVTVPYRITTTACLTFLLTLGLSPWKILASYPQDGDLSRELLPNPEILVQQRNGIDQKFNYATVLSSLVKPQSSLLKCGYTKKQISLKLPSDSPSPPQTQKPGSRIEDYQNLRCAGHRPLIPLIALIPESNIGITINESPTFLIYLPDANLEDTQGELIIYDQEHQPIYEKTFNLNYPDSIISIDLSSDPNLPKLEVGKSYFWTFGIIFDPIDQSDSTYVSGWIGRVEPSSEIKHKLANSSPQEQPNIYAAHGIWYEAVASLAKLRCSHPDDLTVTSNWESLLQQVGLSEIAKKTIAQCQ